MKNRPQELPGKPNRPQELPGESHCPQELPGEPNTQADGNLGPAQRKP